MPEAPVVSPIEHLDQEWAVPCDVESPLGCGAENPAAWVMHLSPCCSKKPTSVVLFCDPCKQTMCSQPRLQCRWCGHLWKPGSSAYSLIEPLNGGS